MTSKILIGCDPEVFISAEGSIISGIGIVGGSKAAPRPVQFGTLQEDNVLAEIGIDPAATEDEWVTRITSVLGQLRQHLASIDATLDFKVQASAVLEDHWLMHPMAMEFGCDPDFNAYTREKNPRPSAETNLRTAGGHIHFGYDTNLAEREDVIKAADVFIGLPAVLMDDDAQRMMLYGKAGAYRPKSYGVEYRTPSNFWLRDERTMRWVYQQAVRCVSAAADTQFMEYVNAKSSAICAAINGHDRGAAAALCAEFGSTAAA